MSRGKIKAGNIRSSGDRIVVRKPKNARAAVSFSFQYIDSVHAKFDFAKQSAVYFCKVIERLQGISSITLLEFTTNRNAALKSHCIDWVRTSEPAGFAHLNEQFQSYTPYQFAVSRNEHGRVHGFFIGDVFHVVWLDPDHLLYPAS